MAILNACTPKEDPLNPSSEAKLIFKFKFDPTQERLNNLGLPSAMPAGNAGQSPVFNGMSAHYYELGNTALTPLGKGAVLYWAPETSMGGSNAIDFTKCRIVKEGEVALEVPLSTIPKGTYEYLRVSLAYQNYDIKFKFEDQILNGTLASFIGFNTYVPSFKIKTKDLTVNSNKKQGFWAFETIYSVNSGDAAGTTVPNPIASTSPIPPGSCVVTAAFPKPLVITGSETKDMVVTMSLSVNNSFEWKDVIADKQWEPLKGESVVDMGIRGLKLTVN
ncbi:MAG: hypothetical protein EAZ57_03385 [Cytophagales bacterium]|nr:MAG: hypothetical protein EAZ67_03850 [Cytophagales bacterium]TAF61558.1 MAG: hypothetical protein EAZ57_03385 [Cytophagales bacterium]